MFVVDLSPPSDRLHLTEAEAIRLDGQVRHELICRTVAQVDDLVMVADVPLTPAEAWRLLEKLEDLLTEASVDWQREGF